MMELKVGQELEVFQPIAFEGRTIPAGARVRIGAIVTELLEERLAIAVVGEDAGAGFVLPRHVVTLNCRPVS